MPAMTELFKDPAFPERLRLTIEEARVLCDETGVDQPVLDAISSAYYTVWVEGGTRHINQWPVALLALGAIRSVGYDVIKSPLDWDDVVRAIGRRLWELAPEDFREAAHMDLVFGVTMQDLLAAVEDGLTDAYESTSEDVS